MANTCPKCGASWNGLEYACGSKDELFTGFVQSEKCLADDKTGDFETISDADALAADGKRIFVDEHGRTTPGSAYDANLEKVDEMPPMEPVGAVEGE